MSVFLESSDVVVVLVVDVEEDEEAEPNLKPPDGVPLVVEDASVVVVVQLLPNLKPPEDEDSLAPPNLKPPVESEDATPNFKPPVDSDDAAPNLKPPVESEAAFPNLKPPEGALEESEKVPPNLMLLDAAGVVLEPNLKPPVLESEDVDEPNAAVRGRNNKTK